MAENKDKDAAQTGVPPNQQSAPPSDAPQKPKDAVQADAERRQHAAVGHGDPGETGPADTVADNAGAEQDGLIAVVSNNTSTDQEGQQHVAVGIWERDPRHPGGEVMVAEEPVLVFPTAAVNVKLANGELRRADRKDAEPVKERLARQERVRREQQRALSERENMTLGRFVNAGVEQRSRDAERERLLTGRNVTEPKA